MQSYVAAIQFMPRGCFFEVRQLTTTKITQRRKDAKEKKTQQDENIIVSSFLVSSRLSFLSFAPWRLCVIHFRSYSELFFSTRYRFFSVRRKRARPATAGDDLNPSGNWFTANSRYSLSGAITVVLPS